MKRKTEYQYLFWDLDGTLTESGTGIINSVLYALKKKGIQEEDRAKLSAFIGPPLVDSFMKYYGMTKEEALQSVKDYREYYTAGGMFENEVYPGISELLSDLKAAGYRLVVATSKPEVLSVRILEHFELSPYFILIAGSTMDETRSRKDQVITYALEQLQLDPSSERILMIGDRHHDVDGAKTNGLPCMGVLYGYGDREELEEAGASVICDTVEDIRIFLLEE